MRGGLIQGFLGIEFSRVGTGGISSSQLRVSSGMGRILSSEIGEVLNPELGASSGTGRVLSLGIGGIQAPEVSLDFLPYTSVPAVSVLQRAAAPKLQEADLSNKRTEQ